MTMIGPASAQIFARPTATPAGNPASDGARAAQTAFFRAALGASAPVAPIAPVAAASQTQRTAPTEEASVARSPRPGTLLDIRV